jgi:hypothetical protein
MSDHAIDYEALIHEALLGVVREVLSRVVEDGLPGNHHFYLSFRTDHPGVVVPTDLKMRHPETMTIVLQHQFWDLAVDEEVFGVTLRFGGAKRHVTVPFEALTSFVDPDAEFGLQLASSTTEEKEEVEGAAGADLQSIEGSRGIADKTGEVVSIDEFRKKTE